jgi:hypothetical protein
VVQQNQPTTTADARTGNTFKITAPSDWSALRDAGADVVVDPIVLRTAHLFLLGRKRAPRDPEQVWKAIETNIGALAAFVDEIVLRERRIPVFNYGSSFDLGMRPPGMSPVWEPEPAELLGVCPDVLLPVHISLRNEANYQGEYYALVVKAYEQARTHAPLDPLLAREIVSQLSAYDYTWDPRPTDLNAPNASSPVFGVLYGGRSDSDSVADVVRRYLQGCFIFSGFAQNLGADHLTPPGWSRLYAATALPLRASNEADIAEDAIFRRLAEAGNTDHLGIGRTVEFDQPTFLPYLLDRDDTKTPESLLRQAMELRVNGQVEQYRDYRRQVREEARRGKPETYLREIDELAAAVRRAVTKRPRRWPVKLRASLSSPGLALAAKAEAETEVDLFPAYDWSVRQLPKNGYRKLLLRLLIAQQQTSLLTGPLRDRWEAA